VKIDKLTGGNASAALIELGCPLLWKFIKKGLISIGIIYIPGCVKEAVLDTCGDAITEFFKERRILRRLAALKREVLNM